MSSLVGAAGRRIFLVLVLELSDFEGYPINWTPYFLQGI
jgi:hypothetical protein